MKANEYAIFQRIMSTARTKVVRTDASRLYGAPPAIVASVNPGRASGGIPGLGRYLCGSGRTKRAAYEDLREQLTYQIQCAVSGVC